MSSNKFSIARSKDWTVLSVKIIIDFLPHLAGFLFPFENNHTSYPFLNFFIRFPSPVNPLTSGVVNLRTSANPLE